MAGVRAQAELLARATRLADAVTRRSGCAGLNGLDFIARDGVPFPIEVNPRYSASMELVKRARTCSLFALHRDACDGRLPAAGPRPPACSARPSSTRAADVVMGALAAWVAT